MPPNAHDYALYIDTALFLSNALFTTIWNQQVRNYSGAFGEVFPIAAPISLESRVLELFLGNTGINACLSEDSLLHNGADSSTYIAICCIKSSIYLSLSLALWSKQDSCAILYGCMQP